MLLARAGEVLPGSFKKACGKAACGQEGRERRPVESRPDRISHRPAAQRTADIPSTACRDTPPLLVRGTPVTGFQQAR